MKYACIVLLAVVAAVAAEDAIQLVSPMTYGWPMTYGYGVVPVNNYAVRFDAAMAAYHFPALSNYNLRMDTTKEPSAYLPQAYNYGPYGQYATVAVKEE